MVNSRRRGPRYNRPYEEERGVAAHSRTSFAACVHDRFWPLATDRISMADRRFRGIAEVAGPAACPARSRMTQTSPSWFCQRAHPHGAMAATARVSHTGSAMSTLVHPSRGE
jgi:hypothetical protein